MKKTGRRPMPPLKTNNVRSAIAIFFIIPNKRGAMLAHRAVLYPRPGYEKKCVDCHRNLVHNAQAVYRYKVVN